MKKDLFVLLVLLVAAGVWIRSRRLVDTEERNEQTERQVRMRGAVLALASRHNARLGWEKSLKGGGEIKKVFTFQVEDTLMRETRPIVAFGSVDDITRENGAYFVHFREGVTSPLPADFCFVLECSAQQVEAILARGSHVLRSLVDQYAFVASLSSLNRPSFEVKAEPVSAGDAEVVVEPSEFYIARGKCLEVMFVGHYTWAELVTDEQASGRTK